MSMPGVSLGTSTIDCWRCLSPSGAVLPITISSRQMGSIAPDDHHLRPLITYSSPSRSIRRALPGASGAGRLPGLLGEDRLGGVDVPGHEVLELFAELLCAVVVLEVHAQPPGASRLDSIGASRARLPAGSNLGQPEHVDVV